ncbi:MAG: cytochrome c peroxidase [Saprospiraceae bacterium]
MGRAVSLLTSGRHRAIRIGSTTDTPIPRPSQAHTQACSPVGRGVGVLLMTFLLACQSPTKPHPVTPPQPPGGFVAMVIPEDNPLTQEGIALGQRLFFDPILSLDSTISCATCHRPELAFTDGGRISQGVQGRKGRRSATSLLNIGFHYKGVFWDGRSPTLEEQAIHPLTDSVEMAADWSLLHTRLTRHILYPKLFQKAFPGEPISLPNVARALAQFQRTLVSANSKFDRVQQGLDTFTTSEKRGWTIFFDAGYPAVPMAECNHCHIDPLFTTLGFANNGLDPADSLHHFPDKGLGAVTHNPWDNGKFRIPTLRNIELTAPYMHDGRFQTLEEVLAHYNKGGHYAPNLDPNVRPLHLNTQDMADIIAFLRTLTNVEYETVEKN